MIERPDADKLMAGPLGQWLAGQQGARDEAKVKVRKRLTIGGIITAVAAVVLIVAGLRLDLVFFICSVTFGIAAATAQFARQAVTDRLKDGINGAIAKALGLEYSLTVTHPEPFQLAKTFELVPGYDNDHFEDQWSGRLGELPFLLHEAKLTEERGDSKSRRTVTVFEGSILSIGFARKFLGTTLVERERHRRSWFGGEKERIKLGGIELARIDMVDPAFEDKFAVWSSDGVEAHYLVHPEYVERLVAVEQAYQGENIRALFRDGALLVVIETGNMFESGSLESGEDRELLADTIEQFGSLCDLATQLNERPRAGFGT